MFRKVFYMKFELEFKQLRDFCMFFRNTPKMEIFLKLILILGLGGIFCGLTFVLFMFGLSLVY